MSAHGGTIRGETRPEGGARFVFTLPRGEPPRVEDLDDGDDNPAMPHAADPEDVR